MKRSRVYVGLFAVVAPAVFALTIGFGAPRHSPHFCAGGGAVGAPIAASPKAAVLAYVGASAKDWVRQDNGAFPGIRFAPKGNPCGVTVERAGDGWQATENAGL